jgi:perosamine synthetase
MAKSNAYFEELLKEIRGIYGGGNIPLHRPVFEGNERAYVVEAIDSNFVSSVGARVDEFEKRVAAFTGAAWAVATVNGTSALHAALDLADVRRGDEVISQALTFVATCNSISYLGARPVFVDVDLDTMGMSPVALRHWLEANTRLVEGKCVNRQTGARVCACVPMHTFGLPCRVQEIVGVCQEFGVTTIEDAAESLGSYVNGRHTGTFGRMSTLSFNGNKVITTGGGGMILTDDEALAKRAKHRTTTAKVPHPFEFEHDEVGYNYRMPNLNAALGCAQMERLPEMLQIKAEVARCYRSFCEKHGVSYVAAPAGTQPNYWLNAVVLETREARDALLAYANGQGVMMRPIWRLMNHLPMFRNCQNDGLVNSTWLADRVVNLPSCVPDGAMRRVKHADA